VLFPGAFPDHRRIRQSIPVQVARRDFGTLRIRRRIMDRGPRVSRGFVPPPPPSPPTATGCDGGQQGENDKGPITSRVRLPGIVRVPWKPLSDLFMIVPHFHDVDPGGLPAYGYVRLLCVTPWQTRVQLPEKTPASVNAGRLFGGTVLAGDTILVSKLMRWAWLPDWMSSTMPWGS